MTGFFQEVLDRVAIVEVREGAEAGRIADELREVGVTTAVRVCERPTYQRARPVGSR